MDVEYKVSIGEQAEAQLSELYHYIRDALQAPRTADNMLTLLEKEIRSLSFFPNRYELTEEEPWHSLGVHKVTVKNYLVYYLVDEETQTVYVTAVIYGGRDQAKQLSDMDLI